MNKFKYIITAIKYMDMILGWIGKDKIYNFLYPWVYQQIEKIDFEDDELEERTEDLLEAIASMVLKFALGLPFNYEPPKPETKIEK